MNKENPSPSEEEGEGSSSPDGDDAPEVKSKIVKAPLAAPEALLLECVAAWNEMAAGAGLAQVSTMTDKRRIHLRARIVSRWNGETVRQFRAYCRRISKSPFLTGQGPRSWRADFDFAIRSDDVVTRIAEGLYDQQEEASHGA